MDTLPAQRILLIRPSALGDVCRTVPLLVSLKYAYPDAEIDWLVQEGFEDAIRWHPSLSKVVPFPRESLGQAFGRGRFDMFLPWLRHLRAHEYDMVVDAQGLFRSGVISYLSGAKIRIGHRAAREHAKLFYTHRESGSEGKHTVDRMLALAATAGAEEVLDLSLHAPPEDVEAVRFDESLGVRYAVFAPTSRWPGKQWPAERFAAVAERLLAENLVESVVLVGGPGEEDQCGPLLDLASRENRVVNLIQKTSVGRLMALIECSKLVLANDSAALHMAVGFDRPLVALFGPTRVELVGPYEREADVIQHITPADRLDHKDGPTGRALMSRISVDEVVEACSTRLAEG